MHEPNVKPNRLRRSVRASQAADRLLSPGDRSGQAPLQQHDLQNQTPVRSRLSSGATAESPLNDSSSDLHQDIVWDNTSPSTQRLGKRGRRLAAGLVNISDIVSRIAPESGRPLVLEPTLQQWIGDSATIPCTPEVQPPKPKKRSPRPNGVDDLLRLAKQFDFNMLYETRPSNELNQDLEQNMEMPTAHNENLEPDMDWISDEDLDYLFDRSTQSVGDAFSQSLPTQNVQTRTQAGTRCKASGNVLNHNHTENRVKTSQINSSNVQVPQVSPGFQNNLTTEFTTMDTSAQNCHSNHCSPQSKQKQAKTFKFKSTSSSKAIGSVPELAKSTATGPESGFDDDWGEDDLMDDSLLMEMTQNPVKFISPKCTSTQRNGDKTNRGRRTFSLTTQRDLSAEQQAEFVDYNSVFEKGLNRKSQTLQNLSKNSTVLQTGFSDQSIGAKQNSSKILQSCSNLQSNQTTRQQKFSSNFADNSYVGVQSSSTASENCLNVSCITGLGTRSQTKSDICATKSGANSVKVDFSINYGTNPQQRFGATAQTTFISNVKQTPTNSFGTKSGTFSSNNSNTAPHYVKPDSLKSSGGRLQQCFIGNGSSTGSRCNSSQMSSGSGFGKKSAGLLKNDIKTGLNFEKTSQGSSSENCFSARTISGPIQNLRTHTSTKNSEQSVIDSGASLSNTGSEDFPEDDLDSIFSSEPLWDDANDDDLLCELCDDVETHMQRSTNPTQWSRETYGTEKLTNPTSSFNLGENGIQKGGQKLNESALLNQGTNQTMAPSNRNKASPQNLNLQSKARDEFNFKRPNPVWTHNPQVNSKCSAAEIELKKQQAMERRRQRLLTNSNQPISSQTHHNQPSSQRKQYQPISSLRAPT